MAPTSINEILEGAIDKAYNHGYWVAQHDVSKNEPEIYLDPLKDESTTALYTLIASKLEGVAWHYQRTCLNCGKTWWGLHCPHDGYQNPCPACGTKPAQVLLDPIMSDDCGCELVAPLQDYDNAIKELFGD